jgi:hypothetical protein
MHRIALFVFVVALLSLPTITGAQLQPGSTGGTIGKTDKSISGGEERQETGARPERANSSTSRGEHTTSESSIAGRWRWDARCGQGTFRANLKSVKGNNSLEHSFPTFQDQFRTDAEMAIKYRFRDNH